MELTKALFDQIEHGEIFRVVTTRLQNFHDPLKTTLTFVCVKGKAGIDWTIYAGPKDGHPEDIARYGDMVKDFDNIQFICPCDNEVFQLYRY